MDAISCNSKSESKSQTRRLRKMEQVKPAIEFVKEGNHGEIPWEQVDCTIEPMSVEENGGESTEELFTGSGGDVWNNKPNQHLNSIDLLLNKE